MEKYRIDRKFISHKREPFFDIAKKYIKPYSKVLDIGGGDGFFADYCNRNDFFIFDSNKEGINKLQESFPNSVFGHLPLLPFKNNFFDIIHCSHIFEHLEPSEFYDSLKEINRCLSPKGHLVISGPLFWEGFYNDLSHVKPYYPFIFQKYLCGNDLNSLTRSPISKSYIQKELIYRYREKPVFNNLSFRKRNLFVLLTLKFFYLLNSLGLRKYEKTGFTLVLEKTPE